MLPKTGLLIVSNPKKIDKILSNIQKYVKKTLYIQLLSALTEPFGNFHPSVFTTWPKFSNTIFGIYSQAARHCDDLDVRVLLSGLKYNIPKIQTHKPVDLVIFDKVYNRKDIDCFINTKIQNIASEYDILTIDSGDFENLNNTEDKDEKTFQHVVLGGTFDRFHVAHKLLLSESFLRSNAKVTVGITEENMLQSKILWELVADVDVRIQDVKNFGNEVCPELELNIVKISDPFGPAISDSTMEMIVVSKETVRGGQKINEIRVGKGLKPLEIVSIELIDEPNPNPIEESKISSSTARIRALGTLLRPVEPNNNIPSKPYVVGLTGGIASGKSGVAGYLTEFGAQVIDCDKIAHNVYKKGKPCYKLLLDCFGEHILASDGEIDRKVLGGIVFKNPDELTKLNSLVWPAIAADVNALIAHSDKNVVVIEAAVLLTAGWQKFCHEVWTTFVPKEEAINRLVNRNKLTLENAESRIKAQPSNSDYVKSANVVFCTLWAPEYTKQQVQKAWMLLQRRLINKTNFISVV